MAVTLKKLYPHPQISFRRIGSIDTTFFKTVHHQDYESIVISLKLFNTVDHLYQSPISRVSERIRVSEESPLIQYFISQIIAVE